MTKERKCTDKMFLPQLALTVIQPVLNSARFYQLNPVQGTNSVVLVGCKIHKDCKGRWHLEITELSGKIFSLFLRSGTGLGKNFVHGKKVEIEVQSCLCRSLGVFCALFY